ncbi:MAG TPA: DpnD/PcfM family protein [Bacteroidia bacterium]|nr:DpnD/PcfM family protein [Bacteroidia bacterium]HNT81924.1 DpnD/PcfM family protein [Bacteroidia bacterium]
MKDSKTFKIEVQELLSRTINIKANSVEEAISIVNKMYKNEEIVLDWSDLKIQEIIPLNLIQEKEQLINDIIDYLYIDEKKHFEESDGPNDHIYLKIERLKKLSDSFASI